NISTRNESEAEILNRSTVATSQLFIDDVVKKYSYVRNEHDEIDFVLNNEESIPKTTQERKDAIARVQKRIENMIQTEAQAGKINIHKIELSENVSKDSQERESIVQETLSRAKEILDVPIQDL
ncbi:hypothetical protein, partial [Streptomyces galilaeus]|uniref:hypothetical protein n=1 Tax=Streptomyces galilaeus TaxID=33899 RepID=UPI0038F7AC8A